MSESYWSRKNEIPELVIPWPMSDEFEQAYALVQVFASAISLATSSEFVRLRKSKALSRLTEICTAQNRKGLILNLMSYTPDHGSDNFRFLTVKHIWVGTILKHCAHALISTLMNTIVQDWTGRQRAAMQIRFVSSGFKSLDQRAHRLLDTGGRDRNLFEPH